MNLLGATALALLAASSASPPEVSFESKLAECDRQALDPDDGKDYYFCYTGLANNGNGEAVIAHLANLTRTRPRDGRLWQTLGALEGDFGGDSKPAFEKALEFLTEPRMRGYRVQVQLNLARRLSSEGDVKRAKALLAEAQGLAAELEHPALEAAAQFQLLGELARKLDGDLLDAFEEGERAYAAFTDDMPYQVRRNAAHNLARAARVLGRYRLAARWARVSAETAEAAGDPHTALYAWRSANWSTLHDGARRHDPHAKSDAEKRIEVLLGEAIALESRRAELGLRKQYAVVAPPRHRLERWTKCRELADELGEAFTERGCAAGIAEQILSDDPARARKIYEELLAKGLESEDGTGLVGAYRLGGRVAIAVGDLDAAWKSWSALLDAVEQRAKYQTRAEGRELIHAGYARDYRLVAGELLLVGGAEPLWQARAFATMERMRGRELAEFSATARSSPAQWVSPTLAEVQASLPSDTAMLMFQVGSSEALTGTRLGGSWLLSITSDAVRSYSLPNVSELEPRVTMLSDALASVAPESLGSARSTLHSVLVAESLGELPAEISNLVVVPDGVLHRLPFAMLASSDGPALVDRFSLSVASSATMWMAVRSSEPAARNLLALADPEPPEVTEGHGSVLARPDARLPSARGEARVAADRVGGSSVVLMDVDASETALSTADDASLIHVAAHTVVDHMRPRGTRIILAADDQRDGYVHLDELGSLDLNGKLVVLAACQGADGELVAGEGAISPARSMFLAGARTVVAGLWEVKDEDAARFFEAFYEAFGDGQTVAQAVASAQRARKEAGAPPSAWAGFVVYGDGALRLSEDGKPNRWWWVGVAALIGALSGWFGTRKW